MPDRLEELERARDTAIAAMDAVTAKHGALNEEEDQARKRIGERRLLLDAEKTHAGARVREAQDAIDRLERDIDPDLATALSSREAEVRKIMFEIRELERDSKGRKWEIDNARRMGADREQLREPLAQLSSLEASLEDARAKLKLAEAETAKLKAEKRRALVAVANAQVKPKAARAAP